jgi:hypothetical protein
MRSGICGQTIDIPWFASTNRVEKNYIKKSTKCVCLHRVLVFKAIGQDGFEMKRELRCETETVPAAVTSSLSGDMLQAFMPL